MSLMGLLKTIFRPHPPTPPCPASELPEVQALRHIQHDQINRLQAIKSERQLYERRARNDAQQEAGG